MPAEQPIERPKGKHELELEAAANKAWAAAREAVTEYGRTQYRLALFRGFIDGYLKAKKDAIEELAKSAAAPVPPKSVEPPPPPLVTVPLAPTTKAPAMALADTVPNPKDVVLNAVKIFPGLRGAELLREIYKTGHQLHERTLRTILFRNKVPAGQRPKEGQLVSFDKRWYIYPDVPPGYQHELQTEGTKSLKRTTAASEKSLAAV